MTYTKESFMYPEHEHNDESLGEYETEICGNCLMASAGLDPWESSTRGEDEYDMCPEWDGWEFDQLDDGEGNPLYGFSWRQCNGCHTTLGGDRYDVTATHWSCPSEHDKEEEADRKVKEKKERQT